MEKYDVKRERHNPTKTRAKRPRTLISPTWNSGTMWRSITTTCLDSRVLAQSFLRLPATRSAAVMTSKWGSSVWISLSPTTSTVKHESRVMQERYPVLSRLEYSPGQPGAVRRRILRQLRTTPKQLSRLRNSPKRPKLLSKLQHSPRRLRAKRLSSFRYLSDHFRGPWQRQGITTGRGTQRRSTPKEDLRQAARYSLLLYHCNYSLGQQSGRLHQRRRWIGGTTWVDIVCPQDKFR